MPFKDKEKNKIWMRNYMRKYWKQKRLEAIKTLNGKCVNCGCDNPDALEFNHMSGGGDEERNKISFYERRLYKEIIAGKRKDIELTCKVCNALHCLVQLKGLSNRWKIIYDPEADFPWAGNVGHPVIGDIPFTPQQHSMFEQAFELAKKGRIPEYRWINIVIHYSNPHNLLELRKYCAGMVKSG